MPNKIMQIICLNYINCFLKRFRLDIKFIRDLFNFRCKFLYATKCPKRSLTFYAAAANY